MDREALAVAVTEILLKHLPASAEPDTVSSIVADLMRVVEVSALDGPEGPGKRLLVVTVIGKNHSGIVHAFSEVLAEHEVDIVDINQTLVHGNFAMMMVVDPASANCTFEELKAALKSRGEKIGVQVYCQFEDIMRAVNRI